jgi:hypothetical protein
MGVERQILRLSVSPREVGKRGFEVARKGRVRMSKAEER